MRTSVAGMNYPVATFWPTGMILTGPHPLEPTDQDNFVNIGRMGGPVSGRGGIYILVNSMLY